jgi:hypothetical protein
MTKTLPGILVTASPLLLASLLAVGCTSTVDDGSTASPVTPSSDKDHCPYGCDDGSGSGSNKVALDIDIDIDASAHASLSLLDLKCGLISLGADIDVDAKAKAKLLGKKLLVVDVDADLSLSLGTTGCKVDPLLKIEACASVDIDIDIDANLDSCKQFCDGEDYSCMSTCNKPGNRIKARVDIDVSACLDIDVKGLSGLTGRQYDLDPMHVVDPNGTTLL